MRRTPHRETVLVHALADGELTPFEAARVRSHLAHCAACARELGDAVHLDDLGQRVAQLEQERRRCCYSEPVPALDGTLFGPDQPCFGCGPVHPFGFRLAFNEEGEELVTRFTPGPQHQGPPGLMHGGLVFTLADELAAWVIIARMGKFGFTAKFAGKLQKPTRVGLELTGRAKLLRSTGRTAEIEVRLSQAELQVYEGTFTFVVLDRAATEKLIGGPLPDAWAKFAR